MLRWEKTTTSQSALNESPSEKEGKLLLIGGEFARRESLNESPSEKEGK